MGRHIRPQTDRCFSNRKRYRENDRREATSEADRFRRTRHLGETDRELEAHQLYLQGRYLWNRRTGENLKKALSYFQQAVEKDPDYALAYTGIADSCALIPVYGAGAPQEYFPRAKAAAEKALHWMIRSPKHTPRWANVFFRYLKLAQSVKEFERSIELNPNYATAHHWYGRLTLLMLGQFDHAMAEVKRAFELDPVSPIIHTDFGAVYMTGKAL